MDSYTHLLDTNSVSDLVRHPQGKAAQCLTLVDPYRVCTRLIVVSELRYGVEKKRLCETGFAIGESSCRA